MFQIQGWSFAWQTTYVHLDGVAYLQILQAWHDFLRIKLFEFNKTLELIFCDLWWPQLWKFVKQNNMWYFFSFQKHSALSISWLLGGTSLSFILASLTGILLFIHVYKILFFGLDLPLPIVPQCFFVTSHPSSLFQHSLVCS